MSKRLTQLEIDIRKKSGSRYKILQGDFLTYGVYLSTEAKMSYIVIQFHIFGDSTKAFPSIYTIARLVNCSERTALRALKELEFFGWIKKVKNERLNIGIKNNTYYPTAPFEENSYDSEGNKKIKLSPVSAKDGKNYRKSLIDKSFKYLAGESDIDYTAQQEQNLKDLKNRAKKRETLEENDFDDYITEINSKYTYEFDGEESEKCPF